MASSEPTSRELLPGLSVGEVQIPSLPPLRNGDHLDQPTFHARYEAMPRGFRAELIEGVVFVAPSPVSCDHGQPDGLVIMALALYSATTQGTKIYANTTTILGVDAEVQPDSSLLIAPDWGGRSRKQGKYVAGPPELVAEVAFSSESYDLHNKRRDYERAGVQEYLVVMLQEQRVVWFVLQNGRFAAMEPDGDGILRSRVFPGLWIDPSALLAQDAAKVLEIAQRGIASQEHAAFVEHLRAEHARLNADSREA
jgi:Uma2 family endonuclease